MDITAIISANLTAWMAESPSLDTLKKLEVRSGIGFSTIRRAKNGDADSNITAKSIAALAEAFGRTPAELLTPKRTENSRPAPLEAVPNCTDPTAQPSRQAALA